MPQRRGVPLEKPERPPGATAACYDFPQKGVRLCAQKEPQGAILERISKRGTGGIMRAAIPPRGGPVAPGALRQSVILVRRRQLGPDLPRQIGLACWRVRSDESSAA